MTKADVIVVGAGPAGSLTAYELARAGVRVILLEEHDQVGDPCHCAGLVSPRTLDLAGIEPGEACLRTYSRARIWGPLGSTAWLESDRVQAVAIDRPALDQHLAQRAAEAGAQLWLGVRAEAFERSGPTVQILAANGRGPETLQAPVLVGADGARSRVARWLDGHEKGTLVPSIRVDLRFKGRGTEDIEIFVGNRVAPGWFAWVIPLGDGAARLGIGGLTRNLKRHLVSFLERVRLQFGEFETTGWKGWLIPVEPLPRIAFDNALLVGDAARQAKPSSGGGIFMGMRAGRLAAQTALAALGNGDPSYSSLRRYEEIWRREEGEELRYNHWLRLLYNSMTDAEVDRLVALCGRSWAQAVIRRLGDIDFASDLFHPIHVALQTVAPRLLMRLAERLRRTPTESIEEDLDTLSLDPEDLFGNAEC